MELHHQPVGRFTVHRQIVGEVSAFPICLPVARAAVAAHGAAVGLHVVVGFPLVVVGHNGIHQMGGGRIGFFIFPDGLLHGGAVHLTDGEIDAVAQGIIIGVVGGEIQSSGIGFGEGYMNHAVLIHGHGVVVGHIGNKLFRGLAVGSHGDDLPFGTGGGGVMHCIAPERQGVGIHTHFAQISAEHPGTVLQAHGVGSVRQIVAHQGHRIFHSDGVAVSPIPVEDDEAAGGAVITGFFAVDLHHRIPCAPVGNTDTQIKIAESLGVVQLVHGKGGGVDFLRIHGSGVGLAQHQVLVRPGDVGAVKQHRIQAVVVVVVDAVVELSEALHAGAGAAPEVLGRLAIHLGVAGTHGLPIGGHTGLMVLGGEDGVGVGVVIEVGIFLVAGDFKQHPGELQHIVHIAGFVGVTIPVRIQHIGIVEVFLPAVAAGDVGVMVHHNVPEVFRHGEVVTHIPGSGVVCKVIGVSGVAVQGHVPVHSADDFGDGGVGMAAAEAVDALIQLVKQALFIEVMSPGNEVIPVFIPFADVVKVVQGIVHAAVFDGQGAVPLGLGEAVHGFIAPFPQPLSHFPGGSGGFIAGIHCAQLFIGGD